MGKPGVLKSQGWPRVGWDLGTEQWYQFWFECLFFLFSLLTLLGLPVLCWIKTEVMGILILFLTIEENLFSFWVLNIMLLLLLLLLLLFSHWFVSDSFVTPWTVAHQAPLSLRFPRQEYWSRLPFPSSGTLPDSGIKTVSCLAGRFFTTGPPEKPWMWC